MTQAQPQTAAQEMWNFLMARKSQMALAMDKTMDPERMIRLAHTAATKTPKLLECPMQSIYVALTRAGQMGLEPETPFGHGYLIPRYNSQTRRQECHFEPSYKGLIHVAKRTGAIDAIWAEVVYERDLFKVVRGHNPTIEHEPYYGADPRGRMIAAYAVACLPGGIRRDVVLHYEDIERVKAFVMSQNKDGTLKGPWASNEGEMAKKSAIRNLFKTLGVGPLEQAAQDFEDEVSDASDVPQPAAKTGGKGESAVLSRLKSGQAAPRELPPAQDTNTLPPEVIETKAEVVSEGAL